MSLGKRKRDRGRGDEGNVSILFGTFQVTYLDFYCELHVGVWNSWVQFSIRHKLILVLLNWNGCNNRVVSIFVLEDPVPVPHALQAAVPRAAVMEVLMLVVLRKTCTGQGVARSLEERSHHTLCASQPTPVQESECVCTDIHTNRFQWASFSICTGC